VMLTVIKNDKRIHLYNSLHIHRWF
jgi:hypothetical protein